LATLAAINIVNETVKFSEAERSKVRLITFCQPRVLSTEAYQNVTKEERPRTRALEKNAIRIWRKGDLVPALPYGWFGYKHFGQSWCIRYDYCWWKPVDINSHSILFMIGLLEKYVSGEDIDMVRLGTTFVADESK